MNLAATFPDSGKWRKCTSDLPDMFYRTKGRPELTIATHRNTIKAWGGRGILDITHINGVDVKFIQRGTYETFNRYEAAYEPDNLDRLAANVTLITSLDITEVYFTKTPLPNTRTVDEIARDARKMVAEKNAKAEAKRKAAKPKRRRISYAERLRKREKWLDSQEIKIAKELAAIREPEGEEIVDLDISWFDNRYGTYDGILISGENSAHVLLSYQTLWSRPDTNWRDLSIQRHPEPIPSGENWELRGYLPDFLSALKGKHVSVNGIYVGKFDTRLVPGWPQNGNTKYGMKKLACMMTNERKIRSMINEAVRGTDPAQLERLRKYANTYNYAEYKKEVYK